MVLLNNFLKILFINIYTYIIIFKISGTNIGWKNVIKITFASILVSFMYIINTMYVSQSTVIRTFISFWIQVFLLKYFIRDINKNLLLTNLIANAITYFIFEASAFIEGLLKFTIHIQNDTLNILIMSIIMGITIHALSKIKRFKNGFSFLRKSGNKEYADFIIIDMSATVLVVYSMWGDYVGNPIKQIAISSIILGILLLIIIQKELTLYYKQKLLQKTIDEYKEEIAQKEQKIEELSEEKYRISKLNHEFYNRQRALEQKVNQFINSTNTETSEELAITKQIKEMTNEYSAKQQETKIIKKIPKTQIEEIDDMFSYMQSECIKNNIEFTLKISGNIHHLINKIITKERLATLIGDYIRDAIIAINSSNNTFRSIVVFLGENNKTYEFCVHDTGIEFEIETLLKLGLEPTTTHKATGGTGIGFMTTFETLKETKASLIIEENHPMNNTDYTKSVKIKFDNKNEYSIISYRAKEIKEKQGERKIRITSTDKTKT